MGSRFVSDDPTTKCGPSDFFAALNICARTFEEYSDYINDRQRFKSENELFEKYLLEQIASEEEWNLIEKIAVFRGYLDRAMKVPRWWEEKGGGKKSKVTAHWSQSILETLITKGNRTRSEVFNMHLAEAFEAWARIAEDNGSIRLWTDDDYKAVEAKHTLELAPGDWDKLVQLRKEQGLCQA